MRHARVIAVLILVACAGGTLDARGFRRQADALCRDAQRLIGERTQDLEARTQRNPSLRPKGLRRDEAVLLIALEINRSTEASLRALRVSDEVRGLRDGLARLLAVSNRSLALAVEAARRGDRKAYVRHLDDTESANAGFRRQARLLGISACAGELPVPTPVPSG